MFRLLRFSRQIILLPTLVVSAVCAGETTGTQTRPNIVYIMSDDHAAHAISCYGSRINKTPHLDQIAAEGMRLTNCFATNALCAPSRAAILTGKFAHLNGVRTHHDPPFDGAQLTYPKLLQKAGYQTAVVGKWHLKSDPTGFDYWNIFPGQGIYHNPPMIEMGVRKKQTGYATDLVTDYSIEFLKKRDPNKPFLLVCQHKAPHREWSPDEKHASMYENETIPTPDTFNDDYSSRTSAARSTEMRVADHMTSKDMKGVPPPELTGDELAQWHYQRYIKDYLRCVASVDDNVGRLMDYLKESGLLDNTIVIYTSDQGFFLGDHGWYDKRFMYEESLRMPFLVRYPKEIKAGTVSDALVMNVDFAPTLLDFAGLAKPEEMQGRSFRAWLKGEKPEGWRKSVYYHYFEFPGEHKVARHYGVRTDRYKLIHFYNPKDEWELFDLEKDPKELRSVYGQPEYAEVQAELTKELKRLRDEYRDGDGPEVVAEAAATAAKGI